MTASVLKQDPNTSKVQKNAHLLCLSKYTSFFVCCLFVVVVVVVDETRCSVEQCYLSRSITGEWGGGVGVGGGVGEGDSCCKCVM